MRLHYSKPGTYRVDERAAFVWCLLTYTIVKFRVRHFSTNVKQLRPLSKA